MATQLAFNPVTAGTVSITVGASTANVALGVTTALKQIRVMNNGSATVWIEFGGSSITAAGNTGIPVAPGATEVFTTNGTYAAAIAAGATGIVYFTPGTGL